MQQVEEVAVFGARVDVTAVSQQLHASTAAGCIEQASPEPVPQDFENLVELVDAETPASKICQHEQLEQLNRRVAPFGVAARVGLVGGNRRRHQSALVPQLQLTRSQSGERGYLARTVRALELHQAAILSAIAAPAKSLSVNPPSLWVE